jgi:hypothetical protein
VDYKFDSLWVGGVLLNLLGCMGVGLWKNIKWGLMIFFSHTRFELGDGSKIKF